MDLSAYVNTIQKIVTPKYKNAADYKEWIRLCPPEHGYLTVGLGLIAAILQSENPPIVKATNALTNTPIGICPEGEVLLRYREIVKKQSVYQRDFCNGDNAEESNPILKHVPVEETVAREIIRGDVVSKLEAWRRNNLKENAKLVAIQRVMRALYGLLAVPESLAMRTTHQHTFTWHIQHDRSVAVQHARIKENADRQAAHTVSHMVDPNAPKKKKHPGYFGCSTESRYETEQAFVRTIMDRELERERSGLAGNNFNDTVSPNSTNNALANAVQRGTLTAQILNDGTTTYATPAIGRTTREKRMLAARSASASANASNNINQHQSVNNKLNTLKNVRAQLQEDRRVDAERFKAGTQVGWKRGVSAVPWPSNTDCGVTWSAPQFAPKSSFQKSQLVSIMGGNAAAPPGQQGGAMWTNWTTSTKAMQPVKDGQEVQAKQANADKIPVADSSSAPGMSMVPDPHALAHRKHLLTEASRTRFLPRTADASQTITAAGTLKIFDDNHHYYQTKNHCTPSAVCGEPGAPNEGNTGCSRAVGGATGQYTLTKAPAKEGGLKPARGDDVRTGNGKQMEKLGATYGQEFVEAAGAARNATIGLVKGARHAAPSLGGASTGVGLSWGGASGAAASMRAGNSFGGGMASLSGGRNNVSMVRYV